MFGNDYDNVIDKVPLYKNTIMQRMLEDDDLMKLLYYQVADAPILDNVPKKARDEMIFKQIFPERVATEIISEQKSIICVEMSLAETSRRRERTMDAYITVYIFTHLDISRTVTGSRKDLIASRVNKVINRTKGPWLGELAVDGMIPFVTQYNLFGGYELTFSIKDFR